jgi:hypothetical protein
MPNRSENAVARKCHVKPKNAMFAMFARERSF